MRCENMSVKMNSENINSGARLHDHEMTAENSNECTHDVVDGAELGAARLHDNSETPENNSAITPLTSKALVDAAVAQGAGLSIPMPFEQKITLIPDTRVAGTTHIDNIDEIVAGLKVDDELELLRERDNRIDAYAIRVRAHGVPIGYICADCNEILARLMDGGKKLSAKLTSIEKVGRWNKLGLEVYLDD